MADFLGRRTPAGVRTLSYPLGASSAAASPHVKGDRNWATGNRDSAGAEVGRKLSACRVRWWHHEVQELLLLPGTYFSLARTLEW